MASTGMKILCLFWVLCPTMALVAKMKTCKDGVAVTHSSVYMKQGVHALLGMTDITNGEFFDTGENGTKDYCLKKGSNLTLSLTQTVDDPDGMNLTLRDFYPEFVFQVKTQQLFPTYTRFTFNCKDICSTNCTLCGAFGKIPLPMCVHVPPFLDLCPEPIFIKTFTFKNLIAEYVPAFENATNLTVPPIFKNESYNSKELMGIVQNRAHGLEIGPLDIRFSIPTDLVKLIPAMLKNMIAGSGWIFEWHFSLKDAHGDLVRFNNYLEVDI